jgi:hypothetical protein
MIAVELNVDDDDDEYIRGVPLRNAEKSTLKRYFLEREDNINYDKVELNVGDDDERARVYRSYVPFENHPNLDIIVAHMDSTRQGAAQFRVECKLQGRDRGFQYRCDLNLTDFLQTTVDL